MVPAEKLQGRLTQPPAAFMPVIPLSESPSWTSSPVRKGLTQADSRFTGVPGSGPGDDACPGWRNLVYSQGKGTRLEN